MREEEEEDEEVDWGKPVRERSPEEVDKRRSVVPNYFFDWRYFVGGRRMKADAAGDGAVAVGVGLVVVAAVAVAAAAEVVVVAADVVVVVEQHPVADLMTKRYFGLSLH